MIAKLWQTQLLKVRCFVLVEKATAPMRWQRYKGDWGLTQPDPRAIVAVLWPWRKTGPTSWKASLAMDFQRFIISRFIWKGQKLTLVRRRYTPSYISLTGPPWCVLPSLSLHLLDQHYNPCQWRSFLLWLLPYSWTNSRWEKNIYVAANLECQLV